MSKLGNSLHAMFNEEPIDEQQIDLCLIATYNNNRLLYEFYQAIMLACHQVCHIWKQQRPTGEREDLNFTSIYTFIGIQSGVICQLFERLFGSTVRKLQQPLDLKNAMLLMQATLAQNYPHLCEPQPQPQSELEEYEQAAFLAVPEIAIERIIKTYKLPKLKRENQSERCANSRLYHTFLFS